jgi:hypothetical protein
MQGTSYLPTTTAGWYMDRLDLAQRRGIRRGGMGHCGAFPKGLSHGLSVEPSSHHLEEKGTMC